MTVYDDKLYEVVEFIAIMQRLIENVYNFLLEASGRRLKKTHFVNLVFIISYF